MKKFFSFKVKEPKIRKQLPSELVVTKVHKTKAKRNKLKLKDIAPESFDDIDFD